MIIYLFQHFIPIGLIAGIGFVFVSGAIPSQSNRIEGFGVDLYANPPLSIDAVDTQLNAIQQAGVKYVRIEMNWSLIETSADVYNWSVSVPLDLFFTSAKSRELKTVAVITGGPVYLVTNSGVLDQKSLGERWNKFIQAAVDHFGEQIDVWEIGYQVNSITGMSSFLSPTNPQMTLQPDPGFYSKLLRSASKIVKNTDPNDEIWMGSLVSASAGNCAMNPLTFMLEINGAKGWNTIDAISYHPERGYAVPEVVPTSIVNPACGSALAPAPADLAAEVQTLQELVRQLGGKPVYITGLSWTQEELDQIHANRTIDLSQMQADLLTRASIMLMAKNSIPLVFWQVDLQNQPFVSAELTNLGEVLNNAKSIGQAQGQTGVVHEYRFQKGAELKIISWRARDGDAPQPVNLAGVDTRELLAFPVDSVNLLDSTGIPIPVDDSGNAIVMLNERPVLFLGKTGEWDSQLQSIVSDQLDIWKNGVQAFIKRWSNDQKATFLRMLEDLFNQAKDGAVDWGEQKIDELLN